MRGTQKVKLEFTGEPYVCNGNAMTILMTIRGNYAMVTPSSQSPHVGVIVCVEMVYTDRWDLKRKGGIRNSTLVTRVAT